MTQQKIGWSVLTAGDLLNQSHSRAEWIEAELPLRNPGALEEVQRHIDKPLAEVAAALPGEQLVRLVVHATRGDGKSRMLRVMAAPVRRLHLRPARAAR